VKVKDESEDAVFAAILADGSVFVTCRKARPRPWLPQPDTQSRRAASREHVNSSSANRTCRIDCFPSEVNGIE
jgi:hypothetical protein